MEITRTQISSWLQTLQDTICKSLEHCDGKAVFEEEKWTREEGGGGRTRIIRNGNVFEKGGVLFSAVEGIAPDFLFTETQHSKAKAEAAQRPQFFATGVSIVIHPQSPLVPIIHMNIRYFEMSDGTRWLGGGIDLTPHYVVAEDAKAFHLALKAVCERHHPDYYSRYKEWADRYFYLPHRQETRGIGGIFFDRLNDGDGMSFEKNLAFWKEVGETFAPLYTSLVDKHKDKAYGPKEKEWQLIRRGRYVEFNLVYDKGTRFGLETNGRVESILMSLPKFASWEYGYTVEKNSAEEATLNYLKKGIDWTV